MKRKEIELPNNIGEVVTIMDEVLKVDKTPQLIKEDHYICYGKEVPLCTKPLGKKGLINKIEYITCPKCLEKLNLKK